MADLFAGSPESLMNKNALREGRKVEICHPKSGKMPFVSQN